MREAREANRPVIAVDLGGSKIAVGIISPRYQILARDRHPTLANEGVDSVINRVASVVKQITSSSGLALSQVGGIGIAAAGAIDSHEGIITLSPNLPGWHDVPLGDIISEELNVRTWLINDANAEALGEHHFGIGRGIDNLVYLAVGTGIGGAIIIDGKLYSGVCGSAGEIGHMTIDSDGPRCECGNIGCFEMLVSGKAMVREAIERIGRGERSSLSETVAGRIANITAREIALAAGKGDSLATEVINNAATYLGIGLVNLVNIFNPEMIIVGGGVASIGDRLLEPARQVVRERAFPVSAAAVRIVTAELGDDAGLLGTALFAFNQEQNGEDS